MDNQVEVYGPQIAFGIKTQEIEDGLLKIRISLKKNVIERLKEKLYCFKDMEFNLNCHNLNLSENIEDLQRIKGNVKSGKLKKVGNTAICTNEKTGEVIEYYIIHSFIEKGSHSFQESYGLKEFLSHLERQSTVLDVLLVQVKAIVSILTKNGLIEGMEEFTKKILKYESYLLNDFQLVNVHFDKKLLEKTFYLSKIDWALFKTIEDAQRIIYLSKRSPLAPLFNAVCDQLAQAWIYIDIFATQYSYRLSGQSDTLTNQIFTRQFEFLTEEEFRIHQHESIRNWNPKTKDLSDSDEDGEEENEKEADCSNIDPNETEICLQDSTIKKEVNRVVAFNHKYSKEVNKLFCKISAEAKVIQLYSTKVKNKSVLREALKVLKSKQQMTKSRESIILEQLSLRDEQFYIVSFNKKDNKAQYFKSRFTLTSGVYKRLGQFDYGQPNCTTDHIYTCIDKKYNSWIYIGEVKEGTDDTKHGIGIQVDNDGNIEEGYWKDGRRNGRGRTIYGYDGGYYIGEFKGGFRNGEGVEYYMNGDIEYEGGWNVCSYDGQGTYYQNGDKYTGIWEFLSKGKGEVNYKDGKKYEGYWDRIDGSYKRHGLGTLYSADGQVLNQGKWKKDEYKGKK